MAVYLDSTGTVRKTSPSTTGVNVSVDNRTGSDQQVRRIVWNLAATPKASLVDTTITATANKNTDFSAYTVSAGITRFEVEVRFPDPHMTSTTVITSTSTAVTPLANYAPGSYFTDSSPTGSI